MTETLSVQTLDTTVSLHLIKDEWNHLLEDSVDPTLYMRFEYILAGIESFGDTSDRLMILVMHRVSDGNLIAIFPLRIRKFKKYGLSLSKVEYAFTNEIDKPYPLIRKEWEESAWSTFATHIMSMKSRWDMLEFMEISDTSMAQPNILENFASRNYSVVVSGKKESPIIALDQDWSVLWDNHKHLRKKNRLMNRDFGDRLQFKIHDTYEEWESCLNAYMDLEQRSWKRGIIGISKNDCFKAFYRNIFEHFSGLNMLVYGFLYVDNLLISGEIAYVQNTKVYFCHGSYDEQYKTYSPGLVSKSFFIKYFHGKGYTEGDYLAGYADYMKNWSAANVSSHTISIYKKNFKIRAYLLLIWIKASIYEPIRNRI